MVTILTKLFEILKELFKVKYQKKFEIFFQYSINFKNYTFSDFFKKKFVNFTNFRESFTILSSFYVIFTQFLFKYKYIR